MVPPDPTGPQPAAELLASVYAELRDLAGAQLRQQRRGHTLQATALVNEAWLKLADRPDLQIESREAFLRLASRVMRNVLVDHARGRNAAKRGGDWKRISLSAAVDGDSSNIDVEALDEALTGLAALSATMAELVELRFFGGLTESEAADAMGISRPTASRQWRMARAWLADRLGMFDEDA